MGIPLVLNLYCTVEGLVPNEFTKLSLRANDEVNIAVFVFRA